MAFALIEGPSERLDPPNLRYLHIVDLCILLWFIPYTLKSSSETLIYLIQCLLVLPVAVIFVYLYQVRKRKYIGIWAAAWVLVAVQTSVFMIGALSLRYAYQAVGQWSLATSAVLFFLGVENYIWGRLHAKIGLTGGIALTIWTIGFQQSWVSFSPLAGGSIGLFAAATILWKESRTLEDLTDRLLACAFGTWGTVWLGASLARSPFDSLHAAVVLAPCAGVATLLVLAVNNREKRITERNMLALSNLNLATSSFVGSEIQRMLAQALDRVLVLAELPIGILLVGNDQSVPLSEVARGIDLEFCDSLRKERLDQYLVGTVASVGGLLGFRDLRESDLNSLENDEPLRRFRELALMHGLTSVVAISLQAKEQAFGLLLLGTPDNRRFTPAELRLLLALGHQIGMAVENSYLVQQTSRRSEELHVLNEIGRALSSTLNKEDLLRKIWEELRRLFDVENLYIASPDPVRDAINFDLEMIGGERQPGHSRPAGNHLTEYIIRTRQPVLIRENFVIETGKLGVHPIRKSGSFCGVPLVAYGQAIGALCIFSDHERAYDEGHLELLRVLASEASIAIENARLFQNERTKARHLSLLNLISRDAIATLNPDEVLTKITEQLENGLNYDHIGIALLDYTTRELVIQAESGARRGALGRRLPLDTGLIGQVARTGRTAIYRSFPNNQNGAKPVLPDSSAAMGLPIFYADHLHGVLYVETLQPVDFSEEETLLLRTLADLVSGALHNALTFQKAQEQAITDGLTGLTNHSSFAISLGGLCRDSSEVKAAFALICLDLDGFKAVNDKRGHLKGDEVLRVLAGILRRSVEGPSILARNGGDEFAAILKDCEAEQAVLHAEKLRSHIAEDIFLIEYGVTASIGVAVFPQHGNSSLELLKAADSAMYEAKRQGGNSVKMAGTPS
jgi:diguanylate cyclase (GGDEF)-like protein